MPGHASEYFGRNLANLLKLLGPAEDFSIDEEDAVIRGMLVMRAGELTWPPPTIEPSPAKKVLPKAAPKAATREKDLGIASPTPAAKVSTSDDSKKSNPLLSGVAILLAAAMMGAIGLWAPPSFVQHFTVFVLACFVGWQLVWKVSASLHTPLMSVTNAISGIIIVGGVLQAVDGANAQVTWLAAAAILVASINIFGGFLVTQRMLKMFRADGARATREDS